MSQSNKMSKKSLNAIVDNITLLSGFSAKNNKPYGFVMLSLKVGNKIAEYRTPFLEQNDLYVIEDLFERSRVDNGDIINVKRGDA